mmetsp:Transcript_11304/g.23374  ORF Transcript_11304/g.23374 Transcript_11304/m.23374 type:complete len:205 (+) Transcript_11304:304-918(+)
MVGHLRDDAHRHGACLPDSLIPGLAWPGHCRHSRGGVAAACHGLELAPPQHARPSRCAADVRCALAARGLPRLGSLPVAPQEPRGPPPCRGCPRQLQRVLPARGPLDGHIRGRDRAKEGADPGLGLSPGFGGHPGWNTRPEVQCYTLGADTLCCAEFASWTCSACCALVVRPRAQGARSNLCALWVCSTSSWLMTAHRGLSFGS